MNHRGVARILHSGGGGVWGVTDRDTIRGLPTIYGLYRCSPSCISGPLTKILYKNTNFKNVGFSTMTFKAKILSWRFRHLNIIGCLLKRRPTRGVTGTPGPPRKTDLKLDFFGFLTLITNLQIKLCQLGLLEATRDRCIKDSLPIRLMRVVKSLNIRHKN